MDNTIGLISSIKYYTDEFILEQLQQKGIDNVAVSHGQVILALSRQPLSMQKIALNIKRDPSTVTTLVKKLIKLGYVESFKDINDGRSNLIKLTEKGNYFLELIIDISSQIFAIQYEGMSPREIKILREMLVKMKDNFAKRGN